MSQRYPDPDSNYERAIYGFAYQDGHARREPMENPALPEVYAQGYDDGFKASIGITWQVEHGEVS